MSNATEWSSKMRAEKHPMNLHPWAGGCIRQLTVCLRGKEVETTSANSFFRKLGNGNPVEMTDSTPERFREVQSFLHSSSVS